MTDEATRLETTLRSLLRGQYSSLTLSYNDHSADYKSAAQAEPYGEFKDTDWVSDAEREKAIATNSVWRLQWYPNTPVGFIAIHASSLSALIEYVENMDAE
ncbi:hypothetical protein FHS82_000986 [Pseudochelatococcus lubricantis]|uniref:Uncharacterized protein n=1 Tax=Pseudochelatococcus lubricantis TaxID=1538102 RepID=A0ABX0V004_9HYPH|nr:hypothetical protein [Pseudochelatococcus lubricantis]NIJ57160.1 hypothetical protein [Pseudochelatococcus lubricantis]